MIPFGLAYSITTSTVPSKGDKDLAEIAKEHEQRTKGGLVKCGGSVISPMQRTVSCDYGVVIIGEIECPLDSGETRTDSRSCTLALPSSLIRLSA